MRGIATFIAWLAGALAGVGAILYAFGYLITRAHLNFLGVPGLYEETGAYFVQEGSIFLLVIAQLIARTALPLLVLLGVVLFGVGGLDALVEQVLARFAPSWPERLTRIKFQTSRLYDRPTARQLLYFLLLVLFFWHSDFYLDAFTRPLQITNVLYGQTAPAMNLSPVTQMRVALLTGDQAKLNAYFTDLLEGEVAAALLLFGAWQVTIGWRWQMFWVSWFFISFVLYSLWLPMAYGVLVHSTEYPVVKLEPIDPSLIRDCGTLFLLSKTPREFVLWDAKGRQLVWLPIADIRRADVKGVANLFKPN